MGDLTGKSIGGYPLVKALSSGSYDATYLATTSADPITIRVLRQDLAQNKKINQVVHTQWERAREILNPNLSAVLGTGIDDAFGVYCLLEHQQTKTLRQMVIDGMSLTWRDALEIISQIAAGLKALHDQGMIHGHPWPGNISLTIDQEIQVEGAGTLTDCSQIPIARFIRGAALGYVAPERIKGAPASPGTDLYGLGMTLYFMLRGQDPFPGQDPEILVEKGLHEEPAPLRTTKAGLKEEIYIFVDRLIAKDPTQRYGTIDDVIGDFHALKSGHALAPLKGGPAAELKEPPQAQAAPKPKPSTLLAPKPAGAPPEKTAEEMAEKTKETSNALPLVEVPSSRKMSGKPPSGKAQFSGKLKTHVGSTIPQSSQEQAGDDLFRQGQLAAALVEWKAAGAAGGDHPGLRAKIELGQFTLNKEIFDHSISEIQSSLAYGLLESAKAHLKTAQEVAGSDPASRKTINELELVIDYRFQQAQKIKNKYIILAVCSVLILGLAVVVWALISSI